MAHMTVMMRSPPSLSTDQADASNVVSWAISAWVAAQREWRVVATSSSALLATHSERWNVVIREMRWELVR